MMKLFLKKQRMVTFFILGIIVIGIIGIIAYRAMPVGKTAQEVTSQTEQTLREKAITEARAIVNAYMNAAIKCERTMMDSFRVNPISDSKFSTCKPGQQSQYRVSSGELISYNKSYDEDIKENTEVALFKPEITKAGNLSGDVAAKLLYLVRYPDNDNVWKVMAH